MTTPPSPAWPVGAVHLISAHEVDQACGKTLVAVCGELVSASEPAPVACPPECECDPQYCPNCVQSAIQWNAALEAPGLVRVLDTAPGDG